MKRNFIIFAVLITFFSSLLFAQDTHITGKPEAVSLVKKVGVYLKENGKAQTVAEINKPFGRFSNRELYIFLVDQNNVMVANGAVTQLVNQNVYDLQDVDGKYMIREMLAAAKEKGYGWVTYKWPNPINHQTQTKVTYFEKQGDVIIACGYYVK